MEGASLNAGTVRFTNLGIDTRLHLFRSFIRKRNRQDPLRSDIVFADQVLNAMCNNFCFTSPGPRDDKQGTVFMRYRFYLFFI